MCKLVEGEPEIGAEYGLLRMTLPYKKGGNTPHARDYLLTPHQALALAAKLNHMALMMTGAAGNVSVMNKRAKGQG